MREKINQTLVLATCPFCGGNSLSARVEDIDGYIAHIECLDCDDMTGPMSEYKYPTKDEAIEDAASVWNRRPAGRAALQKDTTHG